MRCFCLKNINSKSNNKENILHYQLRVLAVFLRMWSHFRAQVGNVWYLLRLHLLSYAHCSLVPMWGNPDDRVFQNIHCKLTLLYWQLGRKVCCSMTIFALIISLDNILQFTFADSFIDNTFNVIECFFDGFALRCDDQVMFPRHDSEYRQHTIVF